jgi:hypothetical protein
MYLWAVASLSLCSVLCVVFLFERSYLVCLDHETGLCIRWSVSMHALILDTRFSGQQAYDL